MLNRPVKWVFEAKAQPERVPQEAVDQFEAVKRIMTAMGENATHFVLACSAPLTARARTTAEAAGIEVWDPPKLLQLAPDAVIRQHLGLSAKGAIDTDQATRAKCATLTQSLAETTPGQESWASYQRLAADTMRFLFCPPLGHPLEELSDADSRNRRDMILENGAPDGFWAQVRTIYDAHYVVVDAKNYKSPLKKGPILHVAHYLKPHGCGMFGIIFSRVGAGPAGQHAVREQWIASKKMIIVLNDSDAKEMLRLKAEASDPEELLRRRIAEFRLSL